MKFIKLFLIFISAMFLFACKGGDTVEHLSDPEINITELITIRYSNEQLEKIKAFDGNIDELNVKYPIQCLRKIDDNYNVLFLSEDKILLVVYNEDGVRLFCYIYNLSKEAAAFEYINIGDPIEKVQKIDPFGEFLFLYAGRNDIPHNSTHYTNDGFFIQISYDENNVVTSIEKYMI